jgi:hypothetical protein
MSEKGDPVTEALAKSAGAAAEAATPWLLRQSRWLLGMVIVTGGLSLTALPAWLLESHHWAWAALAVVALVSWGLIGWAALQYHRKSLPDADPIRAARLELIEALRRQAKGLNDAESPARRAFHEAIERIQKMIASTMATHAQRINSPGLVLRNTLNEQVNVAMGEAREYANLRLKEIESAQRQLADLTKDGGS